MNTLPVTPANCWSRIGSSGDHSCPELTLWNECAHCPIFVRSSRALFDHTPPPGYLEQWTEQLAEPVREHPAAMESLVVFQVAGECLGLRTTALLGIDVYRRPRPIPHRTNEVFLGLVAVEGRIHLCVDLGQMLGNPRIPGGWPPPKWSKLLIIEAAGESLAFPAAEVLGVFRFDSATAQPPPTTLQQAVPSFTTHVFHLQDRHVGVLDVQRLLDHLKRNILG